MPAWCGVSVWLLMVTISLAKTRPGVLLGRRAKPLMFRSRVFVVATDPTRMAQLWRYREGHSEAINTLGAPHKLDVTLPTAALAPFIEQVPDVVHDADPAATAWLFGHVADGNVHVNVTGVDPDDETVDERVLVFAADHGGSISAEHGIGTAKRPWLHLNRSESEIGAFRSIKAALDPAGILNPHVLLPER